MSRDKRAEIVEAMVSAWHREVADCADPECEACNRAASAALDIALKAAAEIAGGWKSSLRPGSQDRLSGHLEARRDIADAILALTSEGTKG